MKKIALLLLVFLSIVLVGCQDKPQMNEDEARNFTYLPTLTKAQFDEKLASGERFYIYIGHYDCDDSLLFNKEFKSLFVTSTGKLLYDLDQKHFYYFDAKEIIPSLSDRDNRRAQMEIYGFYSTPSLVTYENGQVVNMAEWMPGFGFYTSDYMKWFYDNGLVTPVEQVYHEGESLR